MGTSSIAARARMHPITRTGRRILSLHDSAEGRSWRAGRSKPHALVQRNDTGGEVEVPHAGQTRRSPSCRRAPAGRDARGSIRPGSGSCCESRAISLPSAGSTPNEKALYGTDSGFQTLENSSTSAMPPGLRTRYISASARSLWVMFLRPKATVTRSKVRSGNGSRSASHCTAGRASPSSIARSRPMRQHRGVDVRHPDLDPAAPGHRAREVAAAGGEIEHLHAGPQRRLPDREPLPEAGAVRRTSGRSSGRSVPRPSRTRRAPCPPSRFVHRLVAEVSRLTAVGWLPAQAFVLRVPSIIRACLCRFRGDRLDARIGIPALPCRLEPLEVVLPHRLLLGCELVQVVPRVDAGGMAIAEARLDRVVADRLESVDVDVALAHLQGFLPRAMAAHFRRRGEDPQEFEAEPMHARALRTRSPEPGISGERRSVSVSASCCPVLPSCLPL